MKKILLKLLFFMIGLFLGGEAVFGYTAFDGKKVPPLPPPSGHIVNVSSESELQSALQNVQTGQTILLAAGHYDISSIAPVQLQTGNIAIRGATGDPNEVIISGRGFENCIDVDEEMFMLGNNNITIADLTISESRCHGIKFQSGNNDSTLIHNVRFINIGERCIKGPRTTDAADVIIRYSHFENTKVPAANRCGQHDNGNYIAGIDVMSATDWLVHDNVFRNIKGASGDGRGAVFFWQGNVNIVVERNTFIGCDRSICFGNWSGSNDVAGGVIRNNFVVNGPFISIEICNSSDILCYNNTVYRSDPTYFRSVFFGRNGSGNVFKNNIVFGDLFHNEGAFPDTANNIWKTNSGDQKTDWFADPMTGNLHLTANAAKAIDNGQSLVTDDWDGHTRGGAVDIGADEYDSSVSVKESAAFSNHKALLFQIVPNPFNSVTMIHFDVPQNVKTDRFSLQIYNISGELVNTITGTIPFASRGSIHWDGKDHFNNLLPSGSYFLKLSIGNDIRVQKAVLLR